MSDQLNSSNEDGSIRRGSHQPRTLENPPSNTPISPFPVTRSRAGTDQPPPASEPRRLQRQSVDKELVANPAISTSPRRIRARRLSTDDHHEDTPPVRALRGRRISVDRESATGTPKLGDEGSENGQFI